MLTTCMHDRFQQPGYLMCVTLESPLLQAAHGIDYQAVDFLLFRSGCLSLGRPATDIVTAFTRIVLVPLPFITFHIKLLLVLPATNATSERTFFAMRRIIHT